MNKRDDNIIPGPLYISEFSTAELLEELIVRLTLTNGLEFCAPARVNYAIRLLHGGTGPEPEERQVIFGEMMIDRPSMADVLRERLTGERPTPEDERKETPKHIANSLAMYQQITRLAKKEGRW